jgi:hypothetical protein
MASQLTFPNLEFTLKKTGETEVSPFVLQLLFCYF